jgi:carboxymethylenebutenolidase
MTHEDNADRPTITQEMIALYDDYTHLSLNRRKFMDGMVKLTGSAATAVTAAAMIAANARAEDILPESDPSIETESITYPGAGIEMKGYLAWPAESSSKLGTVIVVHENRGLVPHIKDVTRRVAAEGFLALAPDFLSPLGGTPEDEEAARGMFGELTPEMIAENGVATVEFLKSHEKSNGKVGAMGFCWGGGTVNTIAVHSPDLLAAAPYYGRQPDAGDVPKIKAKMVLHFGGLDERINAGIPDFEAAADAAGIDYEVFVYDGANHAFNNDTSEARYDKAAADLAWQRTMELFKETLS